MTRIILSIIILISISTVANAQFTKGSAVLGGTFSFGSNKNMSDVTPEKSSTSSGSFNVSLGKAIRENSLLGIFITYQYNSREYNMGYAPGKDNSNGYGIGLFYRIYKNLGKEFYLFGEVGGGYQGSGSNSYDSSGNKTSTGNTYGGQIYLYPGVAYKVSRKFFIELSIPQLFNAAYSHGNTKSGGVNSSSSDFFYVDANLNSNPLSNIGIGFRLVL